MAVLGLGLAALGRPGHLNVGHGDDLGANRSAQALERPGRGNGLVEVGLRVGLLTAFRGHE
jgi:hypothetical protein